MNSFVSGKRVGAYVASKGAIAQITKAFANEWGDRGVRVNAIAPGYIRTDMTKALQDDRGLLPGHPGPDPGRAAGARRTTWWGRCCCWCPTRRTMSTAS